MQTHLHAHPSMRTPLFPLCLFVAACGMMACSNDAPPQDAAIVNREKLPVMISHGVSKLISDSGINRYKVITEEWAIYDKTTPPRQDFLKGILLLRFDNKMKVDMQITADTAYWYDQNLWELRGRVFVNNEASQTTYRSEQLYWDMRTHEFYSHVWMRIVTPERDIEGNCFKSNENMTRYEVTQDKGSLPVPEDNKQPADSAAAPGPKA